MRRVFGAFIVTGATLLSAETQWEQVYDGMLNGEMVENLYSKYEDIRMPRPAFADIDGDNDKDLFIGDYSGKIHFYRNTGTENSYRFEKEDGFCDSIKIGNNAAPTFGDLDNDGDLDLLVGNGYNGGNGGNLYYYLNVGNKYEADFQLVTDSLNNIDAHDYSVPHLFDNDHDGDLDLLVGGGNGNLFYSENIGDKDSAVWDTVISDYGDVRVGYKAVPAFYDINDDGYEDLVVGNSWGRMMCFLADSNQNYTRLPNYFADYEFGGTNYGNYLALIDDYTAPVFVDLDGDLDKDLVVSLSSGGHLSFIEDLDGVFTWTKDNMLAKTLDIGKVSKPLLKDLNNDGVVDLLIAKSTGYISYYRNDGTNEDFRWTFITPDFLKAKVYNYATLDAADIDGDGDLDFFVGSNRGGISYFVNNGDASNPMPELVSLNYNELVCDSSLNFKFSEAKFLDIDNDLDLDLLLKDRHLNLALYVNVGTAQEPSFEFWGDSLLEGVAYSNCGMSLFDIDNDGSNELIVGGNNLTVYEIDNGSKTFTLSDTIDVTIGGSSFAPTFVRSNNRVQMLVGSWTGEVFLFKESLPVSSVNTFKKNNFNTLFSINDRILHIETMGLSNVTLYNMSGRKVYQKRLESSIKKISLKNYNGVYVLKIRNGKRSFSTKINLL